MVTNEIPHQPKPAIIAVTGATGVGKSYFIRKLGAIQVQSDSLAPEIGNGLESCTAEPELYGIPGTNIVLIDTPGFDDTNISDREMLRRISKVLAGLHVDKTDICGLLYLYGVDAARVTGTARKNLSLFEKVVGANNLRHCTLVTTKWGLVNPQTAIRREQELQNNSLFWRPMLEQGVGCARFDGTRESAMRIITPLANGATFVPQVTAEYVDLGKPLYMTAAGREVEDEVANAKAAHKLDLDEVQEEKKQALREKDYENAAKLEKERAELVARMRKMEQERDVLNVNFEQQRKEMHDKLEQQREEWEAKRREMTDEQLRTLREEREQWEQRARAMEAARKAKSGRAWRRFGLGVLGTVMTVGSLGILSPAVGVMAGFHEEDCKQEEKREREAGVYYEG